MDRRWYASMAIMAGLAILAVAVVVIASRSREQPLPEGSSMNAVRIAAELVQLRLDGSDSSARRRALKYAAGKLADSPLKRELVAFADGNLEAAAHEPAYTPFGKGLQGWVLIELGRRPEAAGIVQEALKEAPIDWELRPLFE